MEPRIFLVVLKKFAPRIITLTIGPETDPREFIEKYLDMTWSPKPVVVDVRELLPGGPEIERVLGDAPLVPEQRPQAIAPAPGRQVRQKHRKFLAARLRNSVHQVMQIVRHHAAAEAIGTLLAGLSVVVVHVFSMMH
jgi:hypothetical protein